MKRNIILLVFAIFIVSCSDTINLSLNYEYSPPSDIEMPEVRHPMLLISWITENVIYKCEENSLVDDWQAPHVTVELMTGDCEDPAILLMSYLEDFGGYETYLVGVVYDNDMKHAVLEINKDIWVSFYTEAPGELFYVMFFPVDEYEEFERWSWEEVKKKNLFRW